MHDGWTCRAILEKEKVIDNKYKPCHNPQELGCDGYYNETCLHDDWNGTLHCNKCGHQVNRHETEEKGLTNSKEPIDYSI